MIDFSVLKLEPAEDAGNAYVGLVMRGGTPVLRLPIGCANIIEEANKADLDRRFNIVKDLYFLLYATLRKYSDIANSMNGKILQDITTARRPQKGRKAVDRHRDKDKDPVALFSYLDGLYGVLELKGEKSLYALIKRFTIGYPDDFSHLHKHLDSATFSEGDVIVIDRARVAKNIPAACPSDLVRLCCFLLSELVHQIKQPLPQYIGALSEEYREKHLHPGAGLFNALSWRDTRLILKEHLEKIFQRSPVKDEEFMSFFDAADHFLNGVPRVPENEEVWGIAGFSQIWEAACIEYIANKDNTVIFAETENLNSIYARKIEANYQHEKLKKALIPIRPDIVWRDKYVGIFVGDVKYKINVESSDCIKQFVYEWVLSQDGVLGSPVSSNVFLLPYEEDGEFEMVVNISVSEILEYIKRKKSTLSDILKVFKQNCEKAIAISGGHQLLVDSVRFKIIRYRLIKVLSAYVQDRQLV